MISEEDLAALGKQTFSAKTIVGLIERLGNDEAVWWRFGRHVADADVAQFVLVMANVAGAQKEGPLAPEIPVSRRLACKLIRAYAHDPVVYEAVLYTLRASGAFPPEDLELVEKILDVRDREIRMHIAARAS